MKKQTDKMNTALMFIIAGILFLLPAGAAGGIATVALPAPGTSAAPAMPSFSGVEYRTKSVDFNETISRAKTYQQKLDVARDYVRSARHAGNSRLQKMFKNFGPGYRINLNDPGVIKDISKLGVNNPNVVKGAARELAFSQKFYNSPSFVNVKVGAPVPTAGGGISDQDITFTSRLTGGKTWLEVKDVKILKLNAQLKAQIDRMAGAKNIQRKIIVNRNSVDPAVKVYARQKGVEVFDNVKSGKIKDTILQQERQITLKKKVATGSFQTALGIWLTASQVWELNKALNNSQLSEGARLRKAGSRGALTVTGAAITAKGIFNVLDAEKSAYPNLKTAQKTIPNKQGLSKSFPKVPKSVPVIAKYSRLLGPVAWAGLGVYAGFEYNRWRHGDINTRHLAYTGASLSGGVGGALAGSKVGAKIGAGIGTALGPKGTIAGGVIGGLAGGISGAFGGSAAAAWAGEKAYDHFRMSNDELNEEKLAALRESL